MTSLAASKLCVRRGSGPTNSRAILKDVSLSAEAGDFVAVIGANGAGKSTLLAALAGLIVADRGSVSLDGRRIESIPRRTLARRLAYLPQNPKVEWPISVERLVALGLTPTLPGLGGISQADAARIAIMLEACDLGERSEQNAMTLSGGELARAMLARAMVGDPDILIVDEPIAGLDPRHAMDTARRLGDLARRGKLVIAALHDLTLAGRHASRILALKDGRIAGEGAARAVLDPALIRAVFGVEARISGEGLGLMVDFLGPA